MKAELTTYRVGLLQARAYRSIKNFLTRRLNAHNLTVPEWSLLGFLHERDEGIRLSDISATLAVEASFSTQLVNALAAKNLLVRRADQADNRAKRVSLTAEGKSLVPQLEAKLREDLDQFMKGLPAEELAIYNRVLELIALKG